METFALFNDAVLLRPLAVADAGFIHTAWQDPAIRRYNRPVPASVADAASLIERSDKAWRAFHAGKGPPGCAFAICARASGEPVGMCGVDGWSEADVAQFGYWLAAGARGRGFATHAVTLMTGWLFELGAARVFLSIQTENTASAAVARRAGFTHEGTLRAHGVWEGQRKDVDLFAVLPVEWEHTRPTE